VRQSLSNSSNRQRVGMKSDWGHRDGPAGYALFNNPCGVCPDGAGGFYVADSRNHAIRHVDKDLNVTTIAGGTLGLKDGDGASAEFFLPIDVALMKDGRLLVAELGTGAIRELTKH